VACISSSGYRKKIKARKVQVKNFQEMKMQGASPASSFPENLNLKDTKQQSKTKTPRDLRVKSPLNTITGVFHAKVIAKINHITKFYIQLHALSPTLPISSTSN
jgi:hypothetical protein